MYYCLLSTKYRVCICGAAYFIIPVSISRAITDSAGADSNQYRTSVGTPLLFSLQNKVEI